MHNFLGPSDPKLTHSIPRRPLILNHAKLDQQRQQLNVLESQKAQAAAALNGQKAARNLAAINLGYTRIVAPTDGMVSERRRRGVEVGRAAAVPFGAGRGDDSSLC
jgi:multidrug efflux pump subunit AcrA (membrane-fusion protein)